MRAKTTPVSYLELGHLSPTAIYALASGKYDGEIVERVLAAAAAGRRHISEADVVEMTYRGRRQGGGLKGIKADQKAEAEAEAARLLALGAWEAACEASSEAERAALEALLEAQQAEAERAVERERAEAEA